MAKVMTSVENMSSALEYATNSMNERLAGRVDAVGHVGKLLTGIYEVEELDSIQNEIFAEASQSYREGYEEMWDTIYNKAIFA